MGNCGTRDSVQADSPQKKRNKNSPEKNKEKKHEKEEKREEELDDSCSDAEEEYDSSDEFEMPVRDINPKNVDNADELGDDFGMRVMSKDDLAGNGMFQLEETTNGECFMAVKPWLGSIVAPDEAPENNPEAPAEDLEIEWVYGYSGNVRSAVFANEDQNVVYPGASLSITFNPSENTQSYSTGQNDDVTCINQHPTDKNIFATGQVATIVNRRGTLPHICVFNSSTGEVLATLKHGHKRAVRCLAFSPDGKYLASVGDDNDYTVVVWDWESGTQITSEKSGNSKVYCIGWNPQNPNEFVTVGTRHVKIWSFENGMLKSSLGRFGSKYQRQTFYALSFSPKGYVLCGSHAGYIYVFVDKVCKAAKKIHQGAIYSMCTTEDEQIITGGRDGFVRILDNKMAVITEEKFNSKVRSVYASGQSLYLGTTNAVFKVNDMTDLSSSDELLKAHDNGELWAIATNPNNANEMASAGEDNRVYVWNITEHKVVRHNIINEKAGPKYSRRKAGTTSSLPPNQCARAIAYSPDGSQLAIGVNSGVIQVYDATSEDLALLVTKDLNQYSKRKVTGQHGNWIQTMNYSPNGNCLAVGTHGLSIVLCNPNEDYNEVATLKTHNAAITHIDWSKDSEHIQSTCVAYELLFHDIPEAIDRASHNANPSALKNVQWNSHTCTFGWPVQGIFSADQDGTDVNVACKNADESLLVTGDDYGNVNLFRYPCAEKGNEKKTFGGHSSHVMNAVFSNDGSHVFTAGGNDKCVIQWKVTGN